jgi:DNA primase
MPNLFQVDKADLLTRLYEHLGERLPSGYGWKSVRCVNPEHEDRHKSASVHATAGKYHCFACDLKGDGFDLAQAIEGWDAKETLSRLGLVAGQEESEWLW